MIAVRIENKPSFVIVGRKTWISGPDNDQFGTFWREAHENGLVAELRKLSKDVPGPVTGSHAFGVSCVENDPTNRKFFFFIAAETDGADSDHALESYTIPACKWAIFSNHGDMPKSLVDAEMYAFLNWLPSSAYKHANAPEMEIYPVYDNTLVEFWLPII